ncbi:hypothetical protein Ancab_000344 [Ancistrocladus abbreviatus]
MAPTTPFPRSNVTTAATLVLRPVSPMPNPNTAKSSTLDYLIGEVELASCIDVLAEGDVVDAKAKIDDPTAIEDATNDDA